MLTRPTLTTTTTAATTILYLCLYLAHPLYNDISISWHLSESDIQKVLQR
jgi:hypothetical protein